MGTKKKLTNILFFSFLSNNETRDLAEICMIKDSTQ